MPSNGRGAGISADIRGFGAVLGQGYSTCPSLCSSGFGVETEAVEVPQLQFTDDVLFQLVDKDVDVPCTLGFVVLKTWRIRAVAVHRRDIIS